MPPKIDGSLTIFHDNFDFFFLDPKVVQEQTCEKLKSDFGLSDDEAKNYYEMIKDEKNNKLIKEIEEKVRTKIEFTGSFVENENIISSNYDK